MKYSIIVPIYKVELYLRECIESVENQTYRDWELILVDDGSPDNCPTICEEYAENDNRIIVVHKTNGGLVSARKAGLEVAKGEYAICLDGDDFLHKECLKTINSAIESYYPDVICFGHMLYSNGNVIYKPIQGHEYGFYNRQLMEEKIFPKLMYEQNHSKINPNLWSKVYRIDLYREYQTKVDSSISMGEDGACVYPLIANSNSIVILSDCLYYYRDNASSMTRMKKPLSWKNFETVYELYEKEIELDRLNMRKQFYQSRVHNLFIIACSMFYVKESYKEITCRIKDEMSKPQNIDAIKNARFKNMKLRLAHFAIKNNLFPLLKLFSLIH